MDKKTTSKPSENFSGNIQYYTLYTSLDITTTGVYGDLSQRLFDILISLISMRAQPIVVAEPYNVAAMENEGAISLSGNGYIFKFIVEHDDIFASVDEDYNIDDPVYHLNYMFDGITVEDQTFVTSGTGKNIEFVYHERL